MNLTFCIYLIINNSLSNTNYPEFRLNIINTRTRTRTRAKADYNKNQGELRKSKKPQSVKQTGVGKLIFKSTLEG